jgi:serine/threonine protein kinase
MTLHIEPPDLPGKTITRRVHDGRWSAVFQALDEACAPHCVKVLACPSDGTRSTGSRQADRGGHPLAAPALPPDLRRQPLRGRPGHADHGVGPWAWIPVAHCVEYRPRAHCRDRADSGTVHLRVAPDCCTTRASSTGTSSRRTSSSTRRTRRLHRSRVVPHGVMGHRDSETGEIVGRVGFVAPEIVQGKPATVQSDVYSVGRVLELMLVHARSEATARTPQAGTGSAPRTRS